MAFRSSASRACRNTLYCTFLPHVPLFVPIVQKLFSVMPQGWTPRGADTTGAPTNAQVLAESLLNVFVLFIQNMPSVQIWTREKTIFSF